VRVARERPESAVIGFTPSRETARRLAVVWGVHAVIAPDAHSLSEAVTRAIRAAQAEGFAQHGDEIVVAAGVPFGQSGTTNTLRVASVG
jgi:pyruvate kinase